MTNAVYVIEWNCHHRNWNGIAFQGFGHEVGIGIQLPRNWVLGTAVDVLGTAVDVLGTAVDVLRSTYCGRRAEYCGRHTGFLAHQHYNQIYKHRFIIHNNCYVK